MVSAAIGVAAAAAAVTAGSAVVLLRVLVADAAGIRLLRRSAGGPVRMRLLACALGLAGVVLAVCAALVWDGLSTWSAVAVGACAGLTPLLAWIDVRIRRLPDRIVLPLVVLTACACALGVVWSAVLAGTMSGLVLLALSLAGGRGRGLAVGLGDVKLAFCVGTITGLDTAGTVVGAFLLANLAGLVEAGIRTVVLRQPLTSRFALGPHLLLGMWAAGLLAQVLR